MSGEQQPLLSVQGPQPGTTGDVSWRERTAELLESTPLHKTVIALITIDTTCVLADLGYTFLSPTCTPEGPDAPLWLNILAHISLVITTLFLVEIPLALWTFGSRYYNPFSEVPHAILHLFDAAIIVTTFVLEVILKGKERELASLLIVLRFWRLVKLVGGIAVGAGELGEADVKELARVREMLKKATVDLYAARYENEELRKRVTSMEQSSTDEI